MKTILLAGITSIALAGCVPENFITSVTNKEPFVPLPSYDAWWAATETCAGASGDLSAISWFLASSITGNGAVANGRWSPPHEIVIVRTFEDDELTVRHEMLHDLLTGDPRHESTSWVTCDLTPS